MTEQSLVGGDADRGPLHLTPGVDGRRHLGRIVPTGSGAVLNDDAAEAVGRASLQVHGAVGYTVEHDLHLLLKRSWALTRSWGTADRHADVVARTLGI